MLKFVSVVALLCLSACSDSGPPHAVEPCVPGQPTFRVSLKNSRGTLPVDASLRVLHGAGCEAYSLSARADAPCAAGDKTGVLFCSAQVAAVAPGEPRGGGGGVAGADGASGEPGLVASAGAAGAGSVDALECEVYSEGAITVAVWRGDKRVLERELSAARDERCGVVTVSATIDLQDASR